ncbi:hypothetical protein TNCV_821241 [Trichonephila clavipes]|nr:hypothetical protein TNCV_821241 [Trichonephila clavipes]
MYFWRRTYSPLALGDVHVQKIVQHSEVWIIEIVLQLTAQIGVIIRDSGETVPSPEWYLLTLPLVLWNLIICLNVLTQRSTLMGYFSIHTELPVHLNKQTKLPACLKQLALEKIGDIPIDVVMFIRMGEETLTIDHAAELTSNCKTMP